MVAQGRFDEAERSLERAERTVRAEVEPAAGMRLHYGRGMADEPQHLREPLSQAEARVLRYLPTKLSAPEIADQLYLSVNTVKTHMRHLYDKLGVHRRHEAVEQARALGLLAPSARRP
jgi:LuxR family maltose regulon positive regulatory protein